MAFRDKYELSKPGTVEEKEKELEALEAELSRLIKKVSGVEVELHTVGGVIDNILELIPTVKRKSAILRFEKTVRKYKSALVNNGIKEPLLEHIVANRKKELERKAYWLDPRYIIQLEKKLDIYTQDSIESSNIFEKFRVLISNSKRMDEIEVILRKVKQKWESQSPLEKVPDKKDIVGNFVAEAGFESGSEVADVLMNSTLEKVRDENAVNEKKLRENLMKIKGEYKKLGDYIVTAMNNKLKVLNELINSKLQDMNKAVLEEAPLKLRILSDLILQPVSLFFSLSGLAVILLYCLGKFGPAVAGYVGGTSLTKIISETKISIVCSKLHPLPVFAAGIVLFLFGGLLKVLDEKLKRAAITKTISGKESKYVY
jgi:hypothetical protein